MFIFNCDCVRIYETQFFENLKKDHFMKPINIFLSFSIVATTLINADQVDLKKGWNLIGVDSTDPVTILTTNPYVLKAAGGGVGGGGDFRYDRKYAKYAKGITKDGQGYWFKVDEEFSLKCSPTITQGYVKETSPAVDGIPVPPAVPLL